MYRRRNWDKNNKQRKARRGLSIQDKNAFRAAERRLEACRNQSTGLPPPWEDEDAPWQHEPISRRLLLVLEQLDELPWSFNNNS